MTTSEGWCNFKSDGRRVTPPEVVVFCESTEDVAAVLGFAERWLAGEHHNNTPFRAAEAA